MFKKILPLFIITLTQAAGISVGTRFNLHGGILQATIPGIEPMVGSSLPYSSIGLDLSKPVNDQLSLGAYSAIARYGSDFKSLSSGLEGHYQLSQHTAVGASIGLQHFFIPTQAQRFFSYGNIHNVEMGLHIRHQITENIYTDVGITRDITPNFYHTRHLSELEISPIWYLSANELKMNLHSSFVSFGYILSE